TVQSYAICSPYRLNNVFPWMGNMYNRLFFMDQERDQRYKELGFRDKITLSSGRFLLGNKYARTFIFFYSIGLHLLVFCCLYRMSYLSYLSTTNVRGGSP
ncbi:Casp-like protein, partial [Thalictrum thalictroides]